MNGRSSQTRVRSSRWRRKDNPKRAARVGAERERDHRSTDAESRPSFTRAAIAAGFLGAALAGCVETGDFGRPRASFVSEHVLPFTGSIVAGMRGELVSFSPYTDDEKELRQRAWRFLAPAHERLWFERQLAELTRTRILPASAHPSDPSAYHGALVSERARSPASRYRRASEDMQADDKLIEPFLRVAERVAAADLVRLRSLAYVRYLNADQLQAAVARVAENRCLAAWVRTEIKKRAASYRYALEHLVIESPQEEATAAERTLLKLEAHVTVLAHAGVDCSVATIVAHEEPAPLCCGDGVLRARPIRKD
jgi:hypothetical protein